MEHTEKHGKPETAGKRRPVWQLVLLDLALTGLVLCVFALFHHVLPSLRQRLSGPLEPIAVHTSAPSPAAVVSPPEERAEPSLTPDPDDWRAKFAGRFSEEPVWTDTGYTSPNIALEISTRTAARKDGQPVTYYVADIYLADLRCFCTCFSNPRYYESGESLAGQYGAILAVNGDYASNQHSGFLVRNGELYYREQTQNDICVLYDDGSVETFAPDAYRVEELLERGVYQSWKFGPELLESDGAPKTEFNTTYAIRSSNPRTGFGYYEPGHYCFVVLDGRQEGYSAGMSMEEFAGIFSQLGCAAAYNMDGGDSSVMVFRGVTYNRPSHGGRDLGDMLYIAEPAGEEEK